MNEFELLLQQATDHILKTEQNFSKLSPTDFEKLVAAALASVSNHHVAYNEGSLSFPDIVVTVGYESYGIEVKLSKSANWKTIGNSIMESTAKNVIRTYIFFGQLIGSKLSIKFRDYAQCIDDIVVTHSPRYHVDMNIDSQYLRQNSTPNVIPCRVRAPGAWNLPAVATASGGCARMRIFPDRSHGMTWKGERLRTRCLPCAPTAVTVAPKHTCTLKSLPPNCTMH